jgi:DNA-binding HxlR family transcriptional regulator
MERVDWSRWPCPVARSVDQLGDGWTLLILRDVFMGVHRFADLQVSLGIAPNILPRRLGALVKHGLLGAQPYSKRPLRHEYVLKPKGEDALPVLLMLGAWGNRWLAPRGAPLVHVDPRTRARQHPVVVDAHTMRPMAPGDVAMAAGPGAPRALKRALARPQVLGQKGTQS